MKMTYSMIGLTKFYDNPGEEELMFMKFFLVERFCVLKNKELVSRV